MNRTTRRAFAWLIAAQAAHSAEEYAFRLYDVFAPARFVSGLVSRDPALGFVVVNVTLVTLGIWCYFARVRRGHSSSRAWTWFWTLLEGANGIGHLLLALLGGGYFPGAATAPLLVGLSAYLGTALVKTAVESSSHR